MSELKGTNVASTIVPFTTDDTYATHDSLYGKGGYKEVATEQERDAIPKERLKNGTKVYVQETKQEYRYVDGVWELLLFGSLNTQESLNDIADVTITDPHKDQILIYNGEKWINADQTVPEIVAIELDDEVTEDSDNAVKSSGIFNAINNMVNGKFIVLNQEEYDSIVHDAETFYFITK